MQNSFARFILDNLHLKIALIIVVSPFIIVSFYTHPVGDDYCESARALELGFWYAQHYWYENFSGRFFSFFLRSAFPYIATNLGDYFTFYKLVPLILLPSLFFAITLLIRRFLESALPEKKVPQSNNILWTGLVVFVIFLTRNPSNLEYFYWLSGALVHAVPSILFLLLLATLLHAGSLSHSISTSRKLFYYLLCGFLALAQAGSNEIAAGLVLAMATLGTFFIWRVYKTRHWSAWLWLSVLVVSIVSTFIAVSAPGYDVREQIVELSKQISMDKTIFSITDPVELIKYFLTTLVSTGYVFVKKIVYWTLDPVLLITSLLAVPLISKITDSESGWKLRLTRLHLLVMTLVWLAFAFIPFYVPQLAGGYIPARAMNTGFLIYLVGWFAMLTFIVSTLSREKSSDILLPDYITVAAGFLLILGLIFNANFRYAMNNAIHEGPIVHKQLMARYDYIKANKNNHENGVIVVPAITTLPRTILNQDPLFTHNNDLFAERYNKCMARFFNVPALIARD